MAEFAITNHLAHHKEELRGISTIDDLKAVVKRIFGDTPQTQVIYNNWIDWPKLFAEVKTL